MAQLLFVSCLFLLFHSTVERNRTGWLVAKFQSLLAIVLVHTGADLDLFDIAEFRTLGASTDGDRQLLERMK